MASKEKILVISNASTPNSGPRGIQVERLLNQLSEYFEILLITSSKSVPLNSTFFSDKTILINTLNETRKGIQKYIRRFWSFLAVFDIVFFIKSYILGRTILRNDNIRTIFCISVSYSNVLSGVLLKKKFNKNINLISFYSDPITNNPYRKSNFLSNKIVEYIERLMIENSDKNIFPSIKMQDYYKSKFSGLDSKMVYIPHAFSPVKSSPTLYSNKKFVIRYLGTLNKERNPFDLIQYIYQNKDYFRTNNISLEFYGRYSKSILKKINEANCDIFSFNDKVPYHETKTLHETADAFLVIDANFKNSMFLPSKLVEIMAFNKPIIILTSENSESEYIGNKTNNFVVHYNNISKFRNVCDELLGLNFSNTASSEFSINNIVTRYKNILTER